MEWSAELQNYAPWVAQRFEMTPLSSKLAPQNSKMRRRGSKISPRAGGLTVGRSWVARGSVVGRWVARGSLILAPVREIRGSLTRTVLSIYN